MIINGKEYKKLVSICNKCHLISEIPFVRPQDHYIESGKIRCGSFELYVNIDSEKPVIQESFNQK